MFSHCLSPYKDGHFNCLNVFILKIYNLYNVEKNLLYNLSIYIKLSSIKVCL